LSRTLNRNHHPPGGAFLFSLNDRPPLLKTLLYGGQWALLFVPIITVSVGVVSSHFQFDAMEKTALMGRILLISGGSMVLQSLVGHRLPLLDGPSSVLMLVLIALAPLGVPSISGGFLVAGTLMALTGFLGLFRLIQPLFTDTVVGVITSLISLSLMPFVVPLLLGGGPGRDIGDPWILLASMAVMSVMVFCSYHLKGLYGSYAFLWSIGVGVLLLMWMGKFHLPDTGVQPWITIPRPLLGPRPEFHPISICTFLLAYLAVLANEVGSVVSTAEVVGKDDLKRKLDLGIGFTGVGGVLSGVFPALGTVSYATSPGVVFATRVASRYALTACGILVFLVACLGKVNAWLAAIPLSVIGAALFVTLGFQLMVGMSIVFRNKPALSTREHYVVGVPLVLGAGAAIIPADFLALLPLWLRVFAGNGLVIGVVCVLLMEHVVLRQPGTLSPASPETGTPFTTRNADGDNTSNHRGKKAHDDRVPTGVHGRAKE